MPRYVAFFGSINVGGNRLRMAELRHTLEREGLEGVETVVASGNVLFDHDERPTGGLEEMLAYILLDRFDVESFAAVRSRDELAQAISGNLFADDGDESQVHALFLERQAEPVQFEQMTQVYAERGPERLALGDRVIYIDFVNGVGGSRLTNSFMERRLGCRGTARNLRSQRRILEKMDKN